jgi:hypothetical protein
MVIRTLGKKIMGAFFEQLVVESFENSLRADLVTRGHRRIGGD